MVSIFKDKKDAIKSYVFNGIESLMNEKLNEEKLHKFFPMFNSLESLYMVDKGCKQITPLYSKNRQDGSLINNSVTSLEENMTLDSDGKYISSVYLSSKDGNACITVAKQVSENEILALNFNLARLLEELNLIDKTKFFNIMSKFIYASIGYSLSLFSLILIFYALYNFSIHLFEGDVNIFQSIFKSTIALTLGLAVFDLAKNLLEHEVIYKEHFKESHGNKKLLEKFLISIIIALSIEALMTVFKIALNDYTDIIYAVYLIIATAILIVSFSYFVRYQEK